MNRVFLALLLVLFAASSSHAQLFRGSGTLKKMMDEYVGRPAQDLIDVIGYPNDQKLVLDDTVLSGGFDSEEGPACTWQIIIDKNRVIKTVSAFGNPWGCQMIIKKMKKAAKAQADPNK